jgi:hypothetical protein
MVFFIKRSPSGNKVDGGPAKWRLDTFMMRPGTVHDG